ncbi:MAG: hypothetical protein K8J09_19450 [Planctomycetes bacterium]|nr:hypothetical protein [Planctomycetota bacterium]
MAHHVATEGELVHLVLSTRLDAPGESWFRMAGEVLRRVARVHASPRRYGLDHDHWSDGAREDLGVAFALHLLERLPLLQQRARECMMGYGYLVQAARSYLVDLQRLGDPIGSAGYRRLQHAVREAVTAEVLVVAPEGPVGSGTLLTLRNVPEGGITERRDLGAVLDCCTEIVHLRAVFARRGRRQLPVLGRLWRHLEQHRVHAFAFGDLLDLLVPRRGETDASADQLAAAPLPREASELASLAVARVHVARLDTGRRHQLIALLQYCQEVDAGQLNLAAVGRELGIDRRRMQELRSQLQDLLGALAVSFGIRPDKNGHRPSSRTRARSDDA